MDWASPGRSGKIVAMQNDPARRRDEVPPETPEAAAGDGEPVPSRRGEIGGPAGPEPTRFGDWEKGGRCIDF
jgi:hypothetical protein